MTAVAEQLDLLDALAADAPPAPVRRRRAAGRTAPAVGGAVVWTERLRSWTAPRNRRAVAHLTEQERAAAAAWPLVWLDDLHAFPSSCTACHAEEGNCFLQDLNHGSLSGRRAATGVCTSQSLRSAHCQSGAVALLAALDHQGKNATRLVDSAREQLADTVRGALARLVPLDEVVARLVAGGLDQTSALAWANAPAAERAVRAGQDGAS